MSRPSNKTRPRSHRPPAPGTRSPTPSTPSTPTDSWDPVKDRLIASGKRFYCLSFSIRSGSTLLCDDLTQWGLGAPAEHFQFPEYPVLDGPLSDHLIRLADQWAGDIFGFKISWYQATEVTSRLRAEGHGSLGVDLRNVFPGLEHIHMVRNDKISQAISAWRAASSQTWHWPAGTVVNPGEPLYDFEAIETEFNQILTDDWLWQFHFEQLGISPLTIYYEDYIQDRPGHLWRVADHLGVPASPTRLNDNLLVMRDEWTDQIARRFKAELHTRY